MGLFSIDLKKALTKEEFDLMMELLDHLADANGDDAVKAAGLYMRLSLNTKFTRTQLKDISEQLLFAGRYMNSRFDENGEVVEVLGTEEKQAIVDLLNKIRRL